MKPWMRSTLLVLFVATAVHVGVFVTLPSVIMKVVFSKVEKQASAHKAIHAPPVTAKSRQVVMPSPDLLYTICTFNLAEPKMMQIKAMVPKSYWSMALYDGQTNNFFVTNDRKVGPGLHTWHLLPPKTKAPASLKNAIVASTTRGILLVRMLMDDPSKLSKLQVIQKQTSCKLLPIPR
ncbi:MAG: DUF1254 domain-containing protein [Deltaproteobacteria bacterium]|nr:MAG: DUF1254 domain-containing protein [Deltaproteobacteria bacterium]